MEASGSGILRRVGSSVENLSSFSDDSGDETRPRRESLGRLNVANMISLVSDGVKEFIEISPDKKTITRKKSFVWSNESRYNDSKIEIFCGSGTFSYLSN